MEGKISDEGLLSIKRGNNFKLQQCPFTVNQLSEGMIIAAKINNCGDWCPLFGEPVSKVKYEYSRSEGDNTLKDKGWELSLCKKNLTFKELKDLRCPEKQS